MRGVTGTVPRRYGPSIQSSSKGIQERNRTAFGTSGSTSKTVFVHLESGHVVQEVTHPSYPTAWTVSIRDEGNAYRGPRVFVWEFDSKLGAWGFLKKVTKDAANGVCIAKAA